MPEKAVARWEIGLLFTGRELAVCISQSHSFRLPDVRVPYLALTIFHTDLALTQLPVESTLYIACLSRRIHHCEERNE